MHENTFEMVVWEMAATLSWPQCVKVETPVIITVLTMVLCVLKAHVTYFLVLYNICDPNCCEQRNQKILAVKDRGSIYTSIFVHNRYIFL